MVSAIVHRWERLLQLLDKQLSARIKVPVEIIDQTRMRIRRFAQDVNQRLTPLTMPSPELLKDEAFKGLRIGPPTSIPLDPTEATAEAREDIQRYVPKYLDHINIPLITDRTELLRVKMELTRLDAVTRIKGKEYRKALTTVNQRLGRMLVAEAAGEEYVPKSIDGPAKFYAPEPCQCGCGKMTAIKRTAAGRPIGVRRFRTGHHLKYYSMLIKVEKGLKRKDDLPDLLRKGLKWTKCELCGGLIPTTDPWGKPVTENVGIACWKEKRGIVSPYGPPPKEPEEEEGTGYVIYAKDAKLITHIHRKLPEEEEK